MKKLIITTIAILFAFSNIYAQKSNSPYEWDWVTDGIWTGAALGGSAYGLYLVQNKEDLTMAEFQSELDNKDDISFLNKWAVGNHSENANTLSDIPFAISFAAPLILLFDDETNDHTGQVLGIYLESLATTAALFSITAGVVNKSRPYVYDESGVTSLERRMGSNGQRSFYSGHVAATATATFFAAKVYSDFNPDGKGKAIIWTTAAVLPAAVGVLRIEGGQHFLTDVLIGYGMGAAAGYFIPELHKKKNNFEIYPSQGTSFNGDEYKAMAFRVKF